MRLNLSRLFGIACRKNGGHSGGDILHAFALKLLPFLCFVAFLASCASNPPEDETEDGPKPSEQPEVPPELAVEHQEAGLDFVDPNTTSELMQEEDKKTIVGPVPVTPPEPPGDSTIEIKTPPAPKE